MVWYGIHTMYHVLYIKRTFSTSYSLRDLRTLEKNFVEAQDEGEMRKKRLKTNVNVNLEMCKQMMYICHVSRVTFCHPQILFADIFSHIETHIQQPRQNE